MANDLENTCKTVPSYYNEDTQTGKKHHTMFNSKEIENIENDSPFYRIVISNYDGDKTKHMNVTPEQLEKIKKVLEDEA